MEAGRNWVRIASICSEFCDLLAKCWIEDPPTRDYANFQRQNVTDVVECRLQIRSPLSTVCLKNVLKNTVFRRTAG